MNGDDELSLKDITFLRAIRDINGSPERYASTEQGVTPATVTAITEATTLTEEEVTYRLDHPRLGKSGLVKVYEAGPPGDESASLNSAELTKAGERAIADAEGHDDADSQDWHPDEVQSEFDEMQEWEPANVETGARGAGGDGQPASRTRPGNTTASASTPTARANAERSPRSRSGVSGAASPAPTTAPEVDESGQEDRLAALEARVEQLEAESTGGNQSGDDRTPAQTEGLADDVAALRKTTDELASRLDDALDELEAIRESEYGAIDEKREAQFETAVKSMVAFHQVATEVLDVRVENYEPAAGRADTERVEITRNRIGDALGVGKSGGGGGGSGISLDAVDDDDSDWPDPEEAARSGRVFSGGGDDDEAEEPKQASDAPESGVYPPLGSDDDSDREDQATDAPTAGAESDVPDSGVYPPLGGDRDGESKGVDQGDDAPEPETAGSAEAGVPDSGVYPPIDRGDETGAGDDKIGGEGDEPIERGDGEAESGDPARSDDGSLPASIRPDRDAPPETISRTAAEDGHVVDPIRETDDGGSTTAAPLDAGATQMLDLQLVINEHRSEHSGGSWRLAGVEPADAFVVREAVRSTAGADTRHLGTGPGFDDPYPDDEAYARIVGELPDSRSEDCELPTVTSTDEDGAQSE